ncbi:MAG TPA: hypothetical protein VI815_00975 [Candidatus Nanoarchaeia archaeon]|nr:hypothetical protein [Candidatus Nanoarchaeia archaeon]
MSEQNSQSEHSDSKEKLNKKTLKDSLKSLNQFYNKQYKIILFIPIILTVLCLIYLAFFYIQHGDIINRDISLTGGTSIQVNVPADIEALQTQLESNFGEVSIREISDLFSGKQLGFIVETSADSQEVISFLEDYLSVALDQSNSSVEFTGSVIGQGFYIQILLAILFSFIFMGTVVFFIFSNNKKIKYGLIVLVLIPPLLFFFLNAISITIAFILSIILLITIVGLAIKYSIPAAAVIFAAFADIVMTLTIVNLLGMEVSSGGIIAFLMLIGYSIDTDILLTARVLRRSEGSVNSKIFGAFKTGMTMTLTAIAVILVGLFITSSYSKVLEQIFFILAIGLAFDIFNTWVTNASMIKWYVEVKND